MYTLVKQNRIKAINLFDYFKLSSYLKVLSNKRIRTLKYILDTTEYDFMVFKTIEWIFIWIKIIEIKNKNYWTKKI